MNKLWVKNRRVIILVGLLILAIGIGAIVVPVPAWVGVDEMDIDRYLFLKMTGQGIVNDRVRGSVISGQRVGREGQMISFRIDYEKVREYRLSCQYLYQLLLWYEGGQKPEREGNFVVSEFEEVTARRFANVEGVEKWFQANCLSSLPGIISVRRESKWVDETWRMGPTTDDGTE